MAKRLFKIAKEFNVGTTTVVDFLKSKDYEIRNKPNAKISDEMYDELLVAFKSSADVKQRAEELVIGSRIEKDKESSDKKETKKPRKSSIASEIQQLAKKKKGEPEEEAEVEAQAESETKTEAHEPKVEEKTKEPATSDQKDEAKKEEETSEKKKSEPESKDSVEEKPEEKKPKGDSKTKDSKKDSDSKDDSKEEKKDTESKSDDSPEDKSDKKPGLKVVGKIDLDADKKKKEKKKKASADKKKKAKSDEKKAAEKSEEKQKESKPAAKKEDKKSSKKKESKKDDVVKVSAPKLKGLKVMGKMDPEKLKEKKKSGKRKRKRKRKTVSRKSKRNKGRRSNKGGRKSQEEKVVSQKEIDDKIKATMARMSGTGGGRKSKRKKRKSKKESLKENQSQEVANQQEDKTIEVTEFISVSEFANLMDKSPTDIIMACMNLGIIVSINQRLDAEIIELVASEFDYDVEFISAEEQIDDEDEWEDDPEDLEPRAAIVTVMGHVDHGKTSLLDHIREANVASGEAGGITQHIGAYEVNVGEKKVTFLDTPGHEAFTAMRARGAKVTDVAVIIIAADDRIMPQTKEAISHAEAAGVPIVFAINKIDKPGADPDRIINELSQMNYLVEAWGGKYQSQNISAKTGENIDLLLEKITLESAMLELKANPSRPSVGAVIEASLDKGRGYVTKVLVQDGTLNIGDPIVAGEHHGKIKAMFNEFGQNVESVGPSQPTLILGLSGAPQAGETFKEMETEQEAKSLANKRAQIIREQSNRASKRISLDEIGRRLALGTFKELNLIVKGDVDGSVEALADALIKLSVETIQVNVIHKAVGQIIESDVLLASASDAIIIGFQVRPSSGARNLAEQEGVQIKTYSIIYEAIEEIKLAMEGMLEPTEEEKVVGQVEVREIYKISKVGTVAGCIVQEGKISRNHKLRVVRDGIVVYPTKEGVEAKLESLKRYKEDVKEVKAGIECGVSVENFNDIKVGDIIEPYEIIEIKQTLN